MPCTDTILFPCCRLLSAHAAGSMKVLLHTLSAITLKKISHLNICLTSDNIICFEVHLSTSIFSLYSANIPHTMFYCTVFLTLLTVFAWYGYPSLANILHLANSYAFFKWSVAQMSAPLGGKPSLKFQSGKLPFLVHPLSVFYYNISLFLKLPVSPFFSELQALQQWEVFLWVLVYYLSIRP